MTIEARVAIVRERIVAAAAAAGRSAEEITLCAATKTQSDEAIRAAIAAGIKVCGENRVQELSAHLRGEAYAGAQVHFIGHLQTNKVRQVVGKVDLIQSVDSARLLEAIAKQAQALGVTQDFLIEVNLAGEASKGGIPPQEVLPLAALAAESPYVRLRGLMTIPPVSLQLGQNRAYFANLRKLLVDITGKISDNHGTIKYLSMGMSGDFEDAILEGATLVRVGTALFGPRPPLDAH